MGAGKQVPTLPYPMAILECDESFLDLGETLGTQLEVFVWLRWTAWIRLVPWIKYLFANYSFLVDQVSAQELDYSIQSYSRAVTRSTLKRAR